MGKEAETPMRMKINWAFKVSMESSAILVRWTSSGTSWKVQFHSSTMVRQYLELASLLRTWGSTLWPLDLRRYMMLL